ncbi:hypothetical protein [Paraburkholderia azotifigens]|uniref:hypothetical protein n=1 Tax=Paraburkholderia azotifigens TaxID=2057004 RepID=UPI0018781058|nr:hypothetical protein [Paraburkholderia azotifigens]
MRASQFGDLARQRLGHGRQLLLRERVVERQARRAEQFDTLREFRRMIEFALDLAALLDIEFAVDVGHQRDVVYFHDAESLPNAAIFSGWAALPANSAPMA